MRLRSIILFREHLEDQTTQKTFAYYAGHAINGRQFKISVGKLLAVTFGRRGWHIRDEC